MASDISNILRSELSNTLEQLLSQSTVIDNIDNLKDNKLDSSQCVQIDVQFQFQGITSSWIFYIPTSSAAQFEYLMLGGTGELKEHIDDEIADAVNEIVSNICGSIATSVNAQGYPDISSLKHEILGAKIIETSELIVTPNTYDFSIDFAGEKSQVIINFDDIFLPFISEITGNEITGTVNEPLLQSNTLESVVSQGLPSMSTTGIDSLLSDEASKNLKLLFDVKLKLSVRLGTKTFLLKDILKWDIGEIIELEQMVNEPLDILVNGIKIGEGEAVIVEGKFGLKVKNIGNDVTSLNKIGLK